VSALSREARAIVDAARRADPPADARRRVRAALSATIAAGPGAAGSSAARASAAKAAVGTGLGTLSSIAALALFFAGGAGLGLLVAGGRGRVVHRIEAPVPVAPATCAPAAQPMVPVPAPVAPLAPSVVGARREHAAPGASLGAEMLLVRGAQIALREGRAGEAMSSLDEHARRFPAGALSRERDGLRAIALCTLERPEARSVAERAILRDPSTPLARRIATACNLDGTDPEATGHPE